MSDFIKGSISRIENRVKHGNLKIKKKKVKEEVLKDAHDSIPDFKRDKICKVARKTAHSATANLKRDVSNEVRNDLGM